MSNPFVAEAYDRLAPTYDGEYQRPANRAEDAWVRAALTLIIREAQLLAALDRRLPEILDAGCGTGLLIDWLPRVRNGDIQYVGLDISRGMLDVARRKYPGQGFYEWDIADIASFSADTPDLLISLFGPISYLPGADLEKFATGMLTVLRPGGRFFIMALAEGRRRKRGVNVEAHADLWHIRSADTLRAYFANFEDVKVRGFSWRPELCPRPAWLSLEARTLGVLTPDRCSYLIVTGRKGR